MRAVFCGSCAKEFDRREANEDAYAFSDDGQRLALSDGASESYDSQLWARMLVRQFVRKPEFDSEWLRTVVSDYHLAHDFSAMRWSQQLSFERGCFATLLAVEHDTVASCIKLFGVGDSAAILFDGPALVRAWPLDAPELFRQRPTLLSTLSAHNHFTEAATFDENCRSVVQLAEYENPTLLCMTDAIAEWTLTMSHEDPERLCELLMIRTVEELERLVSAERKSKRMRVDDSTLIILHFGVEGGSDGLP